ncbi:hypothetical protein Lal_00015953 [Lupinus albus]|uniref:Receptor-like serine/threonine-protein kinase n=1 Tax=Lupinus albus TaxID=3870 RepID=A0A6A5MD33_LUPAL|nr:putative protein kinase RLK-Pelle-DLSV family [Lupinus albus]KAF1872851.1 hypothetical protein Lal_00015953 [Lupinus albus]
MKIMNRHKNTLVLLFFLSLFCFHTLFTHASDSITQSELIKDGDTLVSDGRNFEMGFFSFNDSSSRYVGIWYYNVSVPAYIWVANREKPIKGREGLLRMKNDGNLVVLDENKNEVWSTNMSNPMNNSQAVIQDDGNLVLSNKDDGVLLWQSFDKPTDTFLPGMKIPVSDEMKETKVFRSWKSKTDPSFGNYTMGIDSKTSSPQIVIWEGEERMWRSGYWDGRLFTGVYNMTGYYQFGFKLNEDEKGGRYFTFSKLNKSDKVMFQIGWDGYERMFKWDENEKLWNVLQKEPVNKCEYYNHCGSFGVCDMSNSPTCGCMKGFEPRDKDNWKREIWSGGCKRRTPLKAEIVNGSDSVGEDGFLVQRCMKFPDFAQLVSDPVVYDSKGCESICLQNITCTAYAYVLGMGCMVWYEELVDVQNQENLGNKMNIRLAHSELDHSDKKTKIWIITSTVVGGLICLGIFVWLMLRFKRKLKVSTASRSKNSNLQVSGGIKSREFSAAFSESTEAYSLEVNQLSGPELPVFNFSYIAIATDDFSEENKLGQGGFGPVYKGKLPGGEQIAVKKLSKRSSQGSEEFKNEMMLIAKLQHRNLVRLLGCSIQGEEKLLVYEYMPNKSLDFFLFDPVKQALLDWTKRFEIIEGIALGLLYLHRDSRLRIIHRDLKASNILLDENMNPKISDFGMARIFGGNEDEANTNRVVGTYGYMAPEYAMEGLFSIKSDVYSFGVLLLEIISGRRNTSFRHTDDSSLIGYAWHLWSEQRVFELIDPSIRDSSPKDNVLRCIHIGMLCVQDSAARRPNMSSVLLMLESEATTLPLPKQPLMVTSMRRFDDIEVHTECHDVSNDLTVTMVTGR